MKRFHHVCLSLLLMLTLVGCTGGANVEKIVLQAIEEVELQDGNTSIMLPKTIGGLDLCWEVPAGEDLVKRESYEDYDLISVVFGYDDLTLKLKVTVEKKTQTVSEEFLVNIKSKTTPIRKVYDLNNYADVSVGGVVYAKARKGFEGYYIKDASGILFVYQLSNHVEIGDEVIIEGKKTMHFEMTQLVYNRDTDVRVISKDNPLPEYEESSVSEILDQEVDTKTLAKNVVVQAKVVRRFENFMTSWYLKDIITGEEIFIYYKSAEDLAGLYENKYVEAKVTVYNYNDTDNQWSVFLSNNTNDIKEINPQLSDEEKVDSAINYVQSLYENNKYSFDIDLVSSDLYWGVSIEWESLNKEVVGDDGTVTIPEEEMVVTLKATFKSADFAKTATINVVILPIITEELSEIVAWQVENKTATKEVAFEAVVVENRGTSGYFVINNGFGYYIKGNENDFQAGDRVLVVGNSKFADQPIIDSKRYEILLSSGNSVEEAIRVTEEELLAYSLDSYFYNSYVIIEGTFNALAGQYGASYKFMLGDTELDIHAASNTAGFASLVGSQVQLRAFINRNKSGKWELFIVNRDSDLTVLISDETKVTAGVEYIEKILPNQGLVTTDLRLPTNHPVITDVKYSFSSSNEKVFTDNGKYLRPDQDTNVVITVTVTAGEFSQVKELNYTIKGSEKDKASDLMFTFLLHGIANNKMFSIYNGTGKDVDLSKYKVLAVQNTGIGSNEYTIAGDNAVGVLQLDGILKDGEVLILYHASCNVVILDQIPEHIRKIHQPNQNGVVQFNGKDGDILVLQREGIIIDQIGSYEKLKSQGQSTSWEKEFFGNRMIICKNNNPTPALEWNRFDEVRDVFDIIPANEAPDYKLPSKAWDFVNGTID